MCKTLPRTTEFFGSTTAATGWVHTSLFGVQGDVGAPPDRRCKRKKSPLTEDEDALGDPSPCGEAPCAAPPVLRAGGALWPRRFAQVVSVAQMLEEYLCVLGEMPVGNDSFTIVNGNTGKCIKPLNNWIVAVDCDQTKDMFWKWVSQHRLFHLQSQKCLGLDITKSTDSLRMFSCDSNVMLWWKCEHQSLYGAAQFRLALKDGHAIASTNSSDVWMKGGSGENLCDQPYHENGCEDNWEKDEQIGGCYQFNTQAALSWKEAYVSCQNQGADLLSIHSAAELTYLKGMRSTPTIGGSSCARMDADSGLWQGFSCEAQLPYICKKSLNHTAQLTDVWTYSDTRCDAADWLPNDGFCYLLVNESDSWGKARMKCKTFSSDLISIHSLADVEVVVTKLHNGDAKEEIWTGLRNINTPTLFQWSDGTEVTLTYWDENEPDVPYNKTPNCVSYSGEVSTIIMANEFQQDYDIRDCAAVKAVHRAWRRSWYFYDDREFIYLRPFACDTKLEWICQIPKGRTPKIPDWYNPERAGIHGPPVVIEGSEYWFVADPHLNYEEAVLSRHPWRHFPITLGEECFYMSAKSWFSDLNKPADCSIKLPFICEKYNVSSLEKYSPDPAAKIQCSGDWITFQNKCFLKVKPKSVTFSEASDICHTYGGTLPSVLSQREQEIEGRQTLQNTSETIKYQNNLYKIILKTLTWSDALRECQKENMHLVSITDPYQQAFLTVQAVLQNSSLWIGLSSHDDELNFGWSDGKRLQFNRWAENNEQLEDCVVLDTDGFWKTSDCDDDQPGAICYYSGNETEKEVKPFDSIQCPSPVLNTPWIPFQNSCYNFMITKSRYIVTAPDEVHSKCQTL
ncbi:hypothetical protein CB1_000290014, partial [Camelus ferus]